MYRKPASLESLHPMSARLFRYMQRCVPVEKNVTMDLSDVDLPESALRDSYMIAAYTMRRLQATRYVSSPETTTNLGVTMSCLNELIVQLLSVNRSRTAPGAYDVWPEKALELLREFPYALQQAVDDLRVLGSKESFHVVITGSNVPDARNAEAPLYS